MYCLDWETEGVQFYGTESSGTFSELDIIIMPCNIMGTILGGTEDKIPKECIPDLAKQLEYLGPMNMQVYYNTESFVQDEYSQESRIMRSSTLQTVQVDEFRPNWLLSKV